MISFRHVIFGEWIVCLAILPFEVAKAVWNWERRVITYSWNMLWIAMNWPWRDTFPNCPSSDFTPVQFSFRAESFQHKQEGASLSQAVNHAGNKNLRVGPNYPIFPSERCFLHNSAKKTPAEPPPKHMCHAAMLKSNRSIPPSSLGFPNGSGSGITMVPIVVERMTTTSPVRL